MMRLIIIILLVVLFWTIFFFRAILKVSLFFSTLSLLIFIFLIGAGLIFLGELRYIIPVFNTLLGLTSLDDFSTLLSLTTINDALTLDVTINDVLAERQNSLFHNIFSPYLNNFSIASYFDSWIDQLSTWTKTFNLYTLFNFSFILKFIAFIDPYCAHISESSQILYDSFYSFFTTRPIKLEVQPLSDFIYHLIRLALCILFVSVTSFLITIHSGISFIIGLTFLIFLCVIVDMWVDPIFVIVALFWLIYLWVAYKKYKHKKYKHKK